MGQIRVGFLALIVALAFAAGQLSAQVVDSTAGPGDADGGFPDLWLNIATALGSAAVAAFAAYLKFRMDLAQFRLHFQDQLLDSKTIGIIKDRGHFIDEAQHKGVEEQIRTHGTKFGEAGNRSERIEERLERMSAQAAGHGDSAHAALLHLQRHDVAVAEIRTELKSIDTTLRELRARLSFIPMDQFSSQLARIESNLLEVRDHMNAKLEDPEQRRKEAEDIRRVLQQGPGEKEPAHED